MPTEQISKPAKPTPLANGLVYVSPEMPGLSRVRQGERFRYRNAKGAWIDDAQEVSRINSLAIPPAYTSVWICPLANGHLQAVGLDARGRKQYRYHVQWRALKDDAKFERLEAFGRALPRIRARVARDLRSHKGALRRDTVLATLVRLLDTTFLRVGNEEYANSNGSFGLTTLRNPHAKVGARAVKLRFRGKSGVEHSAEVDDPRIVKIVRRCQQLPGQELFQYEGDDGLPHGLSSTDVNDYLREIVGANGTDDAFTAKDFRTWHGTVQALELTRLACDANSQPSSDATTRITARQILVAVSEQLGNTPAVCKKAYVHPAVLALGARLAKDAQEMRDIWERIGNGHGHAKLHAAERRLLGFLAAHRRTAAREARRVAAQAHATARTRTRMANKEKRQGAPRAKRTVRASSSTTS